MPSSTQVLQNAATANGNGASVDASNFLAAQQVEVAESAGGTATVTFEGSFDGSNWYAIGFQQVDATAAPARGVTAVSVTANMRHVYQLLDPYPSVRARISAIAAGNVTVKLFGVVG